MTMRHKSKGGSAKEGRARPEEKPCVDHSEIAMRAYQRWQMRGCPVGTAMQEWAEAEAEIRAEKALKANQTSGDAGIRNQDLFAFLIAKLGDHDADVREHAMARLTFFGEEALLAIINSLNDPSPRVRSIAWHYFLDTYKDTPFTSEFAKTLQSTKAKSRLEAIREIVTVLPQVQ